RRCEPSWRNSIARPWRCSTRRSMMRWGFASRPPTSPSGSWAGDPWLTEPDGLATRPGGLGEMGMDEFGASHGGLSCSRGPAEFIRTPVMVPGEAVWAVVCATFVRDAQAMLPESHDKPTPEPDDDLEDDPEDEPKDQPDDEPEDHPRDEPDTLY